MEKDIRHARSAIEDLAVLTSADRAATYRLTGDILGSNTG
jgi:hypothetical protein